MSRETMSLPATAPTIPHILLLLLHGGLPAFLGLLPHAGEGELAGRGVPGDGGTGADVGARTDGHRRHQGGVGTDESAVADSGDVLLHAVVVAGDDAGA